MKIGENVGLKHPSLGRLLVPIENKGCITYNVKSTEDGGRGQYFARVKMLHFVCGIHLSLSYVVLHCLFSIGYHGANIVKGKY